MTLKNIKVVKLWPYQVFTVCACAYLLGILLGNLYLFNWERIFGAAAIISLSLLLVALLNFVLENRFLTLASWSAIWILLGFGTVAYRNQWICPAGDIAGGHFEGIITADPQLDYDSQQIVMAIDIKQCGRTMILVKAPRFPRYSYGDRISVFGQLEQPGVIDGFDYGKYLKAKYISRVLYRPTKIELVGSARGLKWQMLGGLYGIKRSFETALNRGMPEPEASLGVGLITGAKRNIPEVLKNQLSVTGLSHIIALSGFNVTIIIIALSALLAGFMNPRQVLGAGSVFVILFVVMTGASASVVRAGIFSLLILLGKGIGRKAHQGNIILLAATLMLFGNPFLLLYDLGFQLSFLAFLGIVYLAEPLAWLLERSKANKLPEWIKLPLIETLSAQFMVFPLIAFAFGRISLISPIANLLVLWILPTAMLLSFLAGMAGMLSIIAGKMLSLLAWPVIAYIVAVADWLSKMPFASLEVSKYNYILIAILYFIILVTYFLIGNKIKRCQKQLLK